MKKISALILILLFVIAPVAAQNTGELATWTMPTFVIADGHTPAALGFICTTSSGGSTPLATYRDTALTQANQNPIRLSASGQPVNSGTPVSIYLLAQSYRFTLYAAGTGNTCNGTAVGTQLRQVDGIYNLAQLFTEAFVTKLDDKVCHAAAYTTLANAGAKIAECLSVLPSTGGTVDARGLEGAQTATANPFASVTKPFVLLLGCATISTSAQWSLTGQGQSIVGAGRCSVLKASGAIASVLKQDGTVIGGNGLQGGYIGHLRIDGNGLATDGWIGTRISGVVVDQVSVTNVTSAGFRCVTASFGCVTVTFNTPIVSVNYEAFSTVPTYGIRFDDSGSSNNTIITSKFEGITTGTGIGILDEGQANNYYGGTTEGNDVGIRTGTNGHHTFYGLFLELNTVADIQIYGFENAFINMTSTSDVANSTQFIGASSYKNRLQDGFYTRITLDVASAYNILDNADATVSLTDNSATTTWRNINVAGVAQQDRGPYTILAETITTLTSTTASITTGNITTANITNAVVSDSVVGAAGAGLSLNLQPGNNSAGDVLIRDYQSTTRATVDQNGFKIEPVAFAALGTATLGLIKPCSDCTVTSGADNTCTNGGTGALAVALNGVWRCFNAQN